VAEGPLVGGFQGQGLRPKRTAVIELCTRTPEDTTVVCVDRRNSLCYQDFLALLEAGNPVGQIVVVTDNLSSHTSVSTREWLAEHPRIRQVFIP